jgi:hypothetical protein
LEGKMQVAGKAPPYQNIENRYQRIIPAKAGPDYYKLSKNVPFNMEHKPGMAPIPLIQRM